MPASGGLTAGPPTIENDGTATYESLAAVRDGPNSHVDYHVTVER